MKDTIKESAAYHFSNGLMCAESVVTAITEAHGIESDLLPKAATAFCSGMSRTCGTCGALTGAVMGISALLGRDGPGKSYDDVYQATSAVIGKFEEEFGTRNCHELLGCDLGTPEGQSTFRKDRLHEKCATYTARAAELAAEALSEKS